MLVECPICKKQIVWENTPTRPFCTPRCRLIDLGEWASGGYSIPTQETPPDRDNENTDSDED